MKTLAALNYYKSRRALAKAAGVSKQAVARWIKMGVVPEKSAYRLHASSNGKLPIGQKDYA